MNRAVRRRAVLLATVAVLVGGAVACTGDAAGGGGGTGGSGTGSGSGGGAPSTPAPVLERIDGPAQVDPSFDPSGGGRDPAAPATTDPG